MTVAELQSIVHTPDMLAAHLSQTPVLLSPTSANHHIFYLTAFNEFDTSRFHRFMVEKQNNGTTTWWRIYQSWHGIFSLENGLELILFTIRTAALVATLHASSMVVAEGCLSKNF